VFEPPQHSLFDRIPAPEATLWKYLSFAKLTLLLNKCSLHCTRVDTFEDRIEGRWPLKDLEFFKRPGNGDALEELARARRSSVVSSWVDRANESAAMWPLYGGNANEGVAITTTFAKLERAVAETARRAQHQGWYAGSVRYLHFGQDEGVISAADGEKPSLLKVFTLKHSSYEHECEVRALGIDFEKPMPRDGAEIAIAPADFIDAIVVNPLAGRWFCGLVGEAAAAHGLEGRVRRSEISDLEEEAEAQQA